MTARTSTRAGGQTPARYILSAGKVVAAPAPVRVLTLADPQVSRMVDTGAGFGAVDRTPPSGPEFVFGSWKWYPQQQLAISGAYGRVGIYSPLLIQALAYCQKLVNTFDKTTATEAARYLDASKVEIGTEAAPKAFHAAVTSWLGARLEKAGSISKKDAAGKSGTDPDNWKDPSQLGNSKSFFGTFIDEAVDTVKPLASALGISAGVALAGLVLLAVIALKK